MKRIKLLTLAEKARLSKKALKRYRNKTKKVRIIKSYTGILIEKRKYDKYKRYIKSKRWASLREQALEYYGRRCGLCGSRFNLVVHHKHYNTLYKENLSDLMVLCDPCHREHHGK